MDLGSESVLFDFSSAEIGAQVAVDDLVLLLKASFGGDRSEAGRYAANVRWQNQKTLRVNDANSIAILGQSYNRAEQYSGRLKTDLLKRLSPEVIKKAYTAYMTISGEAESSEKTEQYFKDENKPITAWQDISLEEMVGRISGRVIGEYRGFQDDEGNTEQDRPMVRLLQVAVGEKFGLQQAGGNPSDKGYKQHYEAASKLAKNPDLMKVMETLVEVIYEESQKTLKEAGFTHIEVERGTKNDALATEIEQSGKATIMLRPVSSWSLDSSTAEMFAQPVDWQRRKSAGVIVKTMVPVEKVFSFGSFGFGRVQEDEVLLLGGDTEVTGRLNTKEPTPKFNPAQFKADFDARQAKMMAILNKTRDTKPIFVDDEEGDWIGTVRRMRSLLKASFGGDRSEAGRYAANIRWQGQRKGVKAKDIRKELKTYFGATVNDYLKSQGYEDLRQKLITNQGRQGDFQLEMIAEKQGFSGKPKVVTAQEMDELEKQGWTIAYRGVQDFKDEEGLETKGEDLAEEFRTGEYFAGHGTSGNGIYFARDEMVAESYAGNTKAKTLGAITYSVKSDVKNGAVIKVAIPPNVLMSQTDFKNELSKHHSKFFRGYAYEGEWYGDDDIGRNLAAKGVRGVEVTLNFSAGPSVGAKAVIIYDRSMLAVEESKKTK
jgi:hypothetical protein